MAFVWDLYARLEEVVQALADVESAEADWWKRWHSEETENRGPLAGEHSRAGFSEQMAVLQGELAHLKVLIDLHQHGLPDTQRYPVNERPAFDMSCDELQDHLQEWMIQVLTSWGPAVIMLDSQRLLLGWAAQLLVGQAPHSASPVYPKEFLNAARSVYAYAISAEIAAESFVTIIGRGRHDPHFLLALASFPFLEGKARRRFPMFLTGSGTVTNPFPIVLKSGKTKTLTPNDSLNNLALTLQLLEREVVSDNFRSRMLMVRSELVKRGVERDVKDISGHDEMDLYSIIYAHRNQNLHGGGRIYPVGLASLLLATLIGLDAVRDQFDALRMLAIAVTRSQAPTDPGSVWPHWIFYPVPFPASNDPGHVHRLPAW